MTDTQRPLPNVNDPLAAPHWAALREGRFEFQHCSDCGYVRWPAANFCPECLSDRAEWKETARGGAIWSYCVYPELIPGFADIAPYTVAAVEMDAGPYLYGIVLDPPADIAIEDRVEVEITPITPEVSVPSFRVSR